MMKAQGRRRHPDTVFLNGNTSSGKVTLYSIKIVKSNFIETKEEFDADPSNRRLLRAYANTLEFTSHNCLKVAITKAIPKALQIVPALHLSDRMLRLCTTAKDTHAVVRDEIAKKYPDGLKSEEISTMDTTLWNAIKFVHAKYYSKSGNFSRWLKVLVDEDFRERTNAKYRIENMTSEQIKQKAARYYEQKLKLATEAAEACSKLPEGVGILKSPPEGWLEEHKCAGNYIQHCIDNGVQPPVILHGCPLPHDEMVQLEDDPRATLYPGDDLPEWILRRIKNTRKGKEWSTWLWANIFATVVFNFMDNHKGGVIRKREEFCMLALHPSSPGYHLFIQDLFFDDTKNAHIPYGRATYLKTAWKTTFDAIFRYKPQDDGGWDVANVYDPKNRFPGGATNFTKAEVDGALEGLI